MRTLFPLLLSLCFLSVSCDLFSDRPKPYDPVKAGAKIIDSFNITGQTVLTDLRGSYYDLALYKDTIYIHAKGTLYVFDKETFNKINEIKIIFFTRPGYLRFNGDGLVIINEKIGFLLCRTQNAPEVYLFLLDMETGESVLIENLGEAGTETNRLIKIGYDKENEYVWLYDLDTSPGNILFYQYNNENGYFIFKKSIKRFSNSMVSPKIFINGDKWFYTGHSYTDPSWGTKTHIGVDRYDINNPSKIEHFINAEYLGTTTIPQNIIYDEPYIYMMVERNKQIQMLKLLPNK